MQNLLTIGFMVTLIHPVQSQDLRMGEDLMDVAVVASPDSQSEACQDMPLNLNMGIEFAQSTPVNLRLKLNENKNEQRHVCVPRTYEDGRQRCVKQNIPIQRNRGFYQDTTYGAAVEVTCQRDEGGCCDPSMIGTFSVKGKEYAIQPIPPTNVPRVKRGLMSKWLNRMKRKAKRLYAVFKQRKCNPTASDYKKRVNDVQNREPNLAHARPMSKAENVITRGNSKAAIQPQPLAAASGATQSGTSRQKYTVGLLVIIDYSVYKRFYDETENSSPSLQERDILAKEALREHAAYIINGIDLRYKNFRNLDVDIVVVGYVINDKETENKWTDHRLSSATLDYVDADTVLRQLRQWRDDMRRNSQIPAHDHVMLLTGYNLTINLWRASRDPGVAGYAYVGAMCKNESVSVIEDIGGLDNILTGAHELGHSLNASHDNSKTNGCRAEDNFIMTPTGVTDGTGKQNLFRFSECSERDINLYIEQLGQNNCLTDEALVYDEDEFQGHVSIQAGQRYSPDEQCTQMLGYPSYYAWGGQLGRSPESICLGMACKNNQGPESFNIFFAYRGTSCGNKKWCINGICTESTDAPVKDDECVHSDSKTLFGENNNLSCEEYISLNPHQCYQHNYFAFCCNACKRRMHKEKIDCEFGDRVPICVKERHCGINQNLRNCCETCSDTPFPDIPLITNKPSKTRKTTTRVSSITTKPADTVQATTSSVRNPVIIIRPPNTSQTPVRPIDQPPLTSKPSTKQITKPTSDAKISTGNNRQLCMDDNASFFRISCSWIAKTLMAKKLCDWNLFQSRCCKPCPTPGPILPTTTISSRETVCIDKEGCHMRVGSSCYIKAVEEQCCHKCQKFKTGNPDCKFGDKNSRCSRLFELDAAFTCTGKVRNICCGSCKDFFKHGNQLSTTTTPPSTTIKSTTTLATTTVLLESRRRWSGRRRLWSRSRLGWNRRRGRISNHRRVETVTTNINVSPRVSRPIKVAKKRPRKAHKRLKERLYGRKGRDKKWFKGGKHHRKGGKKPKHH